MRSLPPRLLSHSPQIYLDRYCNKAIRRSLSPDLGVCPKTPELSSDQLPVGEEGLYMNDVCWYGMQYITQFYFGIIS